MSHSSRSSSSSSSKREGSGRRRGGENSRSKKSRKRNLSDVSKSRKREDWLERIRGRYPARVGISQELFKLTGHGVRHSAFCTHPGIKYNSDMMVAMGHYSRRVWSALRCGRVRWNVPSPVASKMFADANCSLRILKPAMEQLGVTCLSTPESQVVLKDILNRAQVGVQVAGAREVFEEIPKTDSAFWKSVAELGCACSTMSGRALVSCDDEWSSDSASFYAFVNSAMSMDFLGTIVGCVVYFQLCFADFYALKSRNVDRGTKIYRGCSTSDGWREWVEEVHQAEMSHELDESTEKRDPCSVEWWLSIICSAVAGSNLLIQRADRFGRRSGADTSSKWKNSLFTDRANWPYLATVLYLSWHSVCLWGRAIGNFPMEDPENIATSLIGLACGFETKQHDKIISYLRPRTVAKIYCVDWLTKGREQWQRRCGLHMWSGTCLRALMELCRDDGRLWYEAIGTKAASLIAPASSSELWEHVMHKCSFDAERDKDPWKPGLIKQWGNLTDQEYRSNVKILSDSGWPWQTIDAVCDFLGDAEADEYAELLCTALSNDPQTPQYLNDDRDEEIVSKLDIFTSKVSARAQAKARSRGERYTQSNTAPFLNADRTRRVVGTPSRSRPRVRAQDSCMSRSDSGSSSSSSGTSDSGFEPTMLEFQNPETLPDLRDIGHYGRLPGPPDLVALFQQNPDLRDWKETVSEWIKRIEDGEVWSDDQCWSVLMDAYAWLSGLLCDTDQRTSLWQMLVDVYIERKGLDRQQSEDRWPTVDPSDAGKVINDIVSGARGMLKESESTTADFDVKIARWAQVMKVVFRDCEVDTDLRFFWLSRLKEMGGRTSIGSHCASKMLAYLNEKSAALMNGVRYSLNATVESLTHFSLAGFAANMMVALGWSVMPTLHFFRAREYKVGSLLKVFSQTPIDVILQRLCERRPTHLKSSKFAFQFQRNERKTKLEELMYVIGMHPEQYMGVFLERVGYTSVVSDLLWMEFIVTASVYCRSVCERLSCENRSTLATEIHRSKSLCYSRILMSHWGSGQCVFDGVVVEDHDVVKLLDVLSHIMHAETTLFSAMCQLKWSSNVPNDSRWMDSSDMIEGRSGHCTCSADEMIRTVGGYKPIVSATQAFTLVPPVTMDDKFELYGFLLGPGNQSSLESASPAAKERVKESMSEDYLVRFFKEKGNWKPPRSKYLREAADQFKPGSLMTLRKCDYFNSKRCVFLRRHAAQRKIIEEYSSGVVKVANGLRWKVKDPKDDSVWYTLTPLWAQLEGAYNSALYESLLSSELVFSRAMRTWDKCLQFLNGSVNNNPGKLDRNRELFSMTMKEDFRGSWMEGVALIRDLAGTIGFQSTKMTLEHVSIAVAASAEQGIPFPGNMNTRLHVSMACDEHDSKVKAVGIGLTRFRVSPADWNSLAAILSMAELRGLRKFCEKKVKYMSTQTINYVIRKIATRVCEFLTFVVSETPDRRKGGGRMGSRQSLRIKQEFGYFLEDVRRMKTERSEYVTNRKHKRFLNGVISELRLEEAALKSGEKPELPAKVVTVKCAALSAPLDSALLYAFPLTAVVLVPPGLRWWNLVGIRVWTSTTDPCNDVKHCLSHAGLDQAPVEDQSVGDAIGKTLESVSGHAKGGLTTGIPIRQPSGYPGSAMFDFFYCHSEKKHLRSKSQVRNLHCGPVLRRPRIFRSAFANDFLGCIRWTDGNIFQSVPVDWRMRWFMGCVQWGIGETIVDGLPMRGWNMGVPEDFEEELRCVNWTMNGGTSYDCIDYVTLMMYRMIPSTRASAVAHSRSNTLSAETDPDLEIVQPSAEELNPMARAAANDGGGDDDSTDDESEESGGQGWYF